MTTDSALAGRRILVVDNTATSLRLIEFLFLADGCDVVAASSSAQALLRAREVHPDVVFVSLDLERGRGLELVAELQAMPETARALYFGMSASSFSRMQAMRAGLHGWFPIPIDTRTLVGSIDDAVRRHLPSRPPSAWSDAEP